MLFVDLGVEHFRNLVLKISIDFYWGWWRDYAIQNCVWSYRFQHGNVEDRVDHSHGLRESEYEGVRSSFSNDFERSEEFFGELPGGSGHMEILCRLGLQP